MLERFLETAQQRRKQLTVYSPGESDIVDQFATRNVTVERRPLPPNGPEPFVVIRDDRAVAGTIPVDDLKLILTPPIFRPGEREGISEAYRALLDLLEEGLFSSLSFRQLLATSREIEDRAYRVGQGTLRVGFESFSLFEPQVERYRELSTHTDLQIHLYGQPDWTPPEIEGVTYHAGETETHTSFWFLAFDGGNDRSQSCALVARRSNDGRAGFWSYDPTLVVEILEQLRSVEDSN